MRVDARIEVQQVLFEANRLAVTFRVSPFHHDCGAYIGHGPGGGLAIIAPPRREDPQEAILRSLYGEAWKGTEAPPAPDPEERLLFPLLDAVKRFLQTHPVFPAGAAAIVLAAPTESPQLPSLPPTPGHRPGA